MNQILAVDEGPKKQRDAKMPSKTPADLRKVIKVFCILTILFGIAITGQGVYALVNNFSTDADVPKQTMQDNITITGDNTTGKAYCCNC